MLHVNMTENVLDKIKLPRGVSVCATRDVMGKTNFPSKHILFDGWNCSKY